jgi:hypothetical protein
MGVWNMRCFDSDGDLSWVGLLFSGLVLHSVCFEKKRLGVCSLTLRCLLAQAFSLPRFLHSKLRRLRWDEVMIPFFLVGIVCCSGSWLYSVRAVVSCNHITSHRFFIHTHMASRILITEELCLSFNVT